MATSTTGPTDTAGIKETDFAGVIKQELEDISQRRKRRNKSEISDDQGSWEARCHNAKLFGVCISGGGIRSATFALGVLQTLVKKGLLQRADYLSTVSGGGYIGSWLQGILHRPANVNDVFEPLERVVPKPAKQDPVTFLRRYSSYLAPRHGLSIDTLLIPMIWSRNMILNQVIIIAAFLAALLVAFWPGTAFLSLIGNSPPPMVQSLLLALAFIIAIVAVLFMARNLSRTAVRAFPDEEPNASAAARMRKRWRTQKVFDYGTGEGTKYVAGFVVFPIFVAVLLMMCSVYGPPSPSGFPELFDPSVDIKKGAFLFFLFFLLQASGGFLRCFRSQRRTIGGGSRALAFLHMTWMSVLCAVFTWFLFKLVTWLVWQWKPQEASGSQAAVGFAPPLYVLALMSGIVLQIGLMGKDFPDASREWLARTGTLFWTACALWAGYFALAVFAPLGLAKVSVMKYGGPSLASVVLAWLGNTAASVLAGKSAKTGTVAAAGKDAATAANQTSSRLDLLARYGPFVAVGGFLLLLACVAQWLLHFTQVPGCECTIGFIGFKKLADGRYWAPMGAEAYRCWFWPVTLFAVAVAIFLLFSSRVNINEFSMHHFYKNRLVRCYLGSSANSSRVEDSFTGFDPQDDIPLKDLRFCGPKDKEGCGPYPIVNATLNVTAGTELATQERKGLPWIFTPWYSGFFPSRSDKDGEENEKNVQNKTYAPTDQLGRGISLGTAMAISGAAANSSSGFHSSPQTAFLLTLFNVRLGWWIGNPSKKTFTRPGPGVALWWLLRELFGFVDERSAYLNLSDGGHFENLGLYELARRRCRHIIAIDGEEDKGYRFEGLGSAVRKCRADFGIDIVINPRPIQLQDGLSRTHCVVGRIHYPKSDYPTDASALEQDRPGWLLYIKSSITGDEPADVEEYRRKHPDFPQQSTVDQFFTESQFESYRALGAHAAKAALDCYDSSPNVEPDLDQAFGQLSARWEMPPQAREGAFSQHAEAYSKLMTWVADDAELKELDKHVVENFPDDPKPNREAVYFWLELIQLTEDIFLDLNLADKKLWEHPANAGWKKVFEHWASQEPVWDVWDKQRKNYGKSFAYFFDALIAAQKLKKGKGP